MPMHVSPRPCYFEQREESRHTTTGSPAEDVIYKWMLITSTNAQRLRKVVLAEKRR